MWVLAVCQLLHSVPSWTLTPLRLGHGGFPPGKFLGNFPEKAEAGKLKIGRYVHVSGLGIFLLASLFVTLCSPRGCWFVCTDLLLVNAAGFSSSAPVRLVCGPGTPQRLLGLTSAGTPGFVRPSLILKPALFMQLNQSVAVSVTVAHSLPFVVSICTARPLNTSLHPLPVPETGVYLSYRIRLLVRS